ncbi:hypothetical protein BKA62DRAFT_784049 [Auriculariales sp. MPI-PUGE-AT-0066]|nr:hypothetical protein BKA62DRAFT_784049 [Auriculariales sp. MPI-PUGE-AT-0066]
MSYQFWAVASVVAVSGPMNCFLTDIRLASPKQAQFAKQLLGGYFIAPLSFDCLTLLVFIIHALRTLQFSTSSVFLLHGLGGLTRTFVQQGFFYFFAISAINAANTVLIHVAPLDSAFLGCAWMSNFFTVLSLLLPNVLACRLVLELRTAARTPNWTDESQCIASGVIEDTLPGASADTSVSSL